MSLCFVCRVCKNAESHAAVIVTRGVEKQSEDKCAGLKTGRLWLYVQPRTQRLGQNDTQAPRARAISWVVICAREIDAASIADCSILSMLPHGHAAAMSTALRR